MMRLTIKREGLVKERRKKKPEEKVWNERDNELD